MTPNSNSLFLFKFKHRHYLLLYHNITSKARVISLSTLGTLGDCLIKDLDNEITSGGKPSGGNNSGGNNNGGNN